MSQKNNNSAEEAGGAARRFRLPKLFADSADDTLPQELIAGVTQQSDASARSESEYSQVEGETPAAAEISSKPVIAPAKPTAAPVAPRAVPFVSEYSQREETVSNAALPTQNFSAASEMSPATAPRDTESLAAQAPNMAVPGAAYAAVLLEELEHVRDEMENMARTVSEIREHGTAQDKIFDTLHAELQGYKNDFIYEHLKPVVRPLLFLYDSLEQFDGEMLGFEQAYPNERREFSPALVRENVIFFRSQLVEALRICEVVPMEEPEGFFDPRLHKAVEVLAVESELDRVVLRIVRSGWYLNGRVFRPAEVVVGRCEEENSDEKWNAEMTDNSSAENDYATP